MSKLEQLRSALMGLFAAGGVCLAPAHSSAQTPNVLAETYGSWTVQCRSLAAQEDEEVQRSCQASQELRQADTGGRVVLVAITIPEASGSAQVTVIAPFGIYLPGGIKLSVGETEVVLAPVKTCLEGTGCVAESILPSEGLSDLAQGQELTVHMLTAKGRDVLVNLSLDGFDASYKRLQVFQ